MMPHTNIKHNHNQRSYRPSIIIAATACIALIVIVSQITSVPDMKTAYDAEEYIALAHGFFETTQLHFAKRVLHIWIVRGMSVLFGIDGAFFLVGIISLLLFIYIVLTMLCCDIRYPLSLSIALIFLPYLFAMHHGLYNQIIFFAFLSSAYWFLLVRRKYVVSFLLLFLLFLTRDEAIVIAFSFIAATLIALRRNPEKTTYVVYIAAAILVTLLGLGVTAYITRFNTNIFGLTTPFYLVLKIPYHFVRNFLGFQIWLDPFRTHQLLQGDPLIAFEIPRWMGSISSITEIGIYAWNGKRILSTLLIPLSIFGTGPTIMLFFLCKKKLTILENQLAFNAILFYGCTVFVLAPFIGTLMFKLWTNAWPVFFFGIPLLLQTVLPPDNETTKKIIIDYVLSSWLYVLILLFPYIAIFVLLLLVEIFLHRGTWSKLSRAWNQHAAVSKNFMER
jgi:hypothetical protein